MSSQQLLQLQQHQQQQLQLYYQYSQATTYQPDVVAIQVHRNRSTEDIRTLHHQTPAAASSSASVMMLQQAQHQRRQTFYNKPGWRSYEDGDVASSASSVASSMERCAAAPPGGGTLPRPRGTVKPRPVAKISAHRPDEPFSHQTTTPTTPPDALKKVGPPPTPPKRSSSHEDPTAAAPTTTTPPEPIYAPRIRPGVGGVAGGGSCSPPPPPPPPPAECSLLGHGLLSYSDDSAEDFPPPPAPITASDCYLQHGQAAAAASVRQRLDTIFQRSGAANWTQRQAPVPPQPAPTTTTTPIYAPSGGVAGVNHASRNGCHQMASAASLVKGLAEEAEASPASFSSDAELRSRRHGSDTSFKVID